MAFILWYAFIIFALFLHKPFIKAADWYVKTLNRLIMGKKK